MKPLTIISLLLSLILLELVVRNPHLFDGQMFWYYLLLVLLGAASVGLIYKLIKK